MATLQKILTGKGEFHETKDAVLFFGNRHFRPEKDLPEALTPRYLQQVHGNVCWQQKGPLASQPQTGDAHFTSLPGMPLMIRTADCLPIFVTSTRGTSPVLAIHGGWKGLAQNILVHSIHSAFPKVSPRELQVWVGPHIQGSAFYLSRANCEALLKHHDIPQKRALKDGLIHSRSIVPGQRQVNLGRFLKWQCKTLGVGNLTISLTNTYTNTHYHSHRRYPGNPGRQYSFILQKGSHRT